MPISSPVPPEAVAAYYIELGGLSQEDKARVLAERWPARFEGLKPNSVAEACRRQRHTLIAAEMPQKAELDPALREVLRFPYRPVVVVGDVQAPWHCRRGMARVFEVGQSWDIGTLVCNGDWLDNFTISTYDNMTRVSREIELETAGEIFDKCAEIFDEIVFVEGNHEYRHVRLMRGTDSLLGLIRQCAPFMKRWHEFEKKLRLTDRRYAFMEDTPDGIDWCFSHAAYRRKASGSFSREQALIHGCHYWHAHENHLGWTWALNGKFMAVDGGHMDDEERQEYIAKEHSPAGRCPQGFGAIKHGMPFLFPVNSPPEWWDWALSIGEVTE